jgi:hypothetical protein
MIFGVALANAFHRHIGDVIPGAVFARLRTRSNDKNQLLIIIKLSACGKRRVAVLVGTPSVHHLQGHVGKESFKSQ